MTFDLSVHLMARVIREIITDMESCTYKGLSLLINAIMRPTRTPILASASGILPHVYYMCDTHVIHV